MYTLSSFKKEGVHTYLFMRICLIRITEAQKILSDSYKKSAYAKLACFVQLIQGGGGGGLREGARFLGFTI